LMSQIPIKIEGMSNKQIDLEILRAGMIAELDAINMYEQMAGLANDPNIKKMLLDIAREEKTHLGEFQALLINRDAQQGKELENGRKEIKKEVGE